MPEPRRSRSLMAHFSEVADPREGWRVLTWAFSRQGFRFNSSSIVSGRLFRYPGLSPFL